MIDTAPAALDLEQKLRRTNEFALDEHIQECIDSKFCEYLDEVVQHPEKGDLMGKVEGYRGPFYFVELDRESVNRVVEPRFRIPEGFTLAASVNYNGYNFQEGTELTSLDQSRTEGTLASGGTVGLNGNKQYLLMRDQPKNDSGIYKMFYKMNN